MKKRDSKVAHNRPRPFHFTVQSRPQPTAQNWFFMLWNLGTRHLFSYLWIQSIYILFTFTIHFQGRKSYQDPVNMEEKPSPLSGLDKMWFFSIWTWFFYTFGIALWQKKVQKCRYSKTHGKYFCSFKGFHLFMKKKLCAKFKKDNLFWTKLVMACNILQIL